MASKEGQKESDDEDEDDLYVCSKAPRQAIKVPTKSGEEILDRRDACSQRDGAVVREKGA